MCGQLLLAVQHWTHRKSTAECRLIGHSSEDCMILQIGPQMSNKPPTGDHYHCSKPEQRRSEWTANIKFASGRRKQISGQINVAVNDTVHFPTQIENAMQARRTSSLQEKQQASLIELAYRDAFWNLGKYEVGRFHEEERWRYYRKN